jgi:hypothetical protein
VDDFAAFLFSDPEVIQNLQVQPKFRAGYITPARFGISVPTVVIMLFLLPAAVSIVATIVPRRLSETAGTWLTGETQPEFFERVNKAARIANRRPPQRVLLTLDRYCLARRSSLSIGLPLLQPSRSRSATPC